MLNTHSSEVWRDRRIVRVRWAISLTARTRKNPVQNCALGTYYLRWDHNATLDGIIEKSRLAMDLSWQISAVTTNSSVTENVDASIFLFANVLRGCASSHAIDSLDPLISKRGSAPYLRAVATWEASALVLTLIDAIFAHCYCCHCCCRLSRRRNLMNLSRIPHGFQ